MTQSEQDLLQLLKDRSLQLGGFRLASGGTSNYYIDGRMTVVGSRGARLIGEVLYENTKDLPIDALGGPEVGAVPLTTAAVFAYCLHGRDMEGFWVRNKAKEHGTKKMIEGRVQPGFRVVVLEDVVTRGESAIKAVKEVEAFGCKVVMILSLVDRLSGAREYFKTCGVENYRSIFTIRDLGVTEDMGGSN